MQSNLLFLKVFVMFLILASANSRADNPGSIFGIELGQDVFKLSPIEKFGSMYMSFKITPKKPMVPFDLYSIKANNNFQVQGIYARAKVSSEECESELKKIARQIETGLGVTLNETLKRKKVAFISEDDKALLVISCDRYRKYNEKNLKDIVLVLFSKEKILKSLEVDKVKSKKMYELLGRNEIKKREINLVSSHDLSGVWSTDCTDNKSGIAIKKLRDNYYHFLICSSIKCINVPRISSNDVEIVDVENLKIAGQNYEVCTPLDK